MTTKKQARKALEVWLHVIGLATMMDDIDGSGIDDSFDDAFEDANSGKLFKREFLVEVERRAGASREEMVDAVDTSRGSTDFGQREINITNWLRRILGETP